MYWYLSFLRPPPVSVSESSGDITITPQVANDLRTEVRYEATEIYYVWQHVDLKTPEKSRLALKSQHLTTFITPESTYRPLTIPLPQVRAGQKWRLGLFSHESTPGSVSLANVLLPSEAVDVIGVWSEPITITAGSSGTRERESKKVKLDKPKGKGKEKEKEKEKDDAPKQNRIQREWLVEDIEDEEGRMLRIIEQTSYDLDKKIWDSGLALSAWLAHRLNLSSKSKKSRSGNKTEQAIWEILAGTKRTHILELGSGTGLVSIALKASMLLLLDDGHVEITATDLESAMELMRENIGINASASSSSGVKTVGTTSSPDSTSSSMSLEARTLDWDDELPEWVTTHHPNLIIAADVTYNTSSFPALVRTLCNLTKPSSGERPPLLLAYKQREEAERELWRLLSEHGIKLELVDKIAGAEEEGAVEIWVGQA